MAIGSLSSVASTAFAEARFLDIAAPANAVEATLDKEPMVMDFISFSEAGSGNRQMNGIEFEEVPNLTDFSDALVKPDLQDQSTCFPHSPQVKFQNLQDHTLGLGARVLAPSTAVH